MRQNLKKKFNKHFFKGQLKGKDWKRFQRWRKKKKRRKRMRERILTVISQGLETRLEKLGENPSSSQLKRLFDSRL